METRIEKWRAYREEINARGILLDKISGEVKTLVEYKKRIDKIAPKILGDITNDESLSLILSTNSNTLEHEKKLMDILNSIDQNQLNTVYQDFANINSFFQKEVIQEKGISSQWLEKDEKYVSCTRIKQKFDQLKSDIIAFDYILPEKMSIIEQFEALNDEEKNKICIKEHIAIKHQNTIAPRTWYIIIFTTSIITIMAIVVFIVMKVTNSY